MFFFGFQVAAGVASMLRAALPTNWSGAGALADRGCPAGHPILETDPVENAQFLISEHHLQASEALARHAF
jgi:hypothetical protein